MQNVLTEAIGVSHRSLSLEDEDRGLQFFLQTIFSMGDKKDIEVVVKHSRHSRKRASQRSLSSEAILNVLLHGTTFFRQGMTFYAVKEKDIPKSLHHRMVEKIRIVVVVLGHNTKSVVTCYYNKNAFKYLKRKSKELKK